MGERCVVYVRVCTTWGRSDYTTAVVTPYHLPHPCTCLQAQNIKNFKSQRWQTLLSFNSQRRLLLTGTPLQNSVMELWSLMHFLMPSVFSSHTDFKEWFSNPLTGMVEGSQEYSETIIRRLHKVGGRGRELGEGRMGEEKLLAVRGVWRKGMR